MNRVDALLRSPRAVAALVALVAGQDDQWGTTPDLDLVTARGGQLAPDRLTDAESLTAVATAAVQDWRWRTDIDHAALGDFAARVRPAAEQLATAPAGNWWWQPLDRRRQIWIGPPEETPDPTHAQLDDHEWGSWPTKPRRALWTTTLVDSTPAALFSDWDGALKPPLALWQLDVPASARVFEIATADDWRRLCQTYPKDTTATYRRFFHQWGVPGSRVITPDWAAVARDWDGVHLTLSGLLLAEATPQHVDGDAGTSMEGWGCEMTQWFRWVFNPPRPVGTWTSPIPA